MKGPYAVQSAGSTVTASFKKNKYTQNICMVSWHNTATEDNSKLSLFLRALYKENNKARELHQY